MSPLASTLEKLQLEKQDLAKRRMQKQAEGQEKVLVYLFSHLCFRFYVTHNLCFL